MRKLIRKPLGTKSDFRLGGRYEPLPTALKDGKIRCYLCPKSLAASEVAIRSHLRKHIRAGELDQSKYLAKVQELMRQ